MNESDRGPVRVTIRPVTTQDTDAVVSLWELALPEYNDPERPQRAPRPNIERKLAWADGLFWLAHRGEDVVGTVMAGYDGHRGWIYSLAVHPEYRRAGLGVTLVKHAEKNLAELGCPKVNLQVAETNDGGIAFWDRAGYRPDHVRSLGKRLTV